LDFGFVFRSNESGYGDEEGRKVFIGNLPLSVTEQDLKQAFDRYGTMTACYIPTNRLSGESRDFGFVVYDHARSAREAIDAMQGYSLKGQELHVTAAHPRRERRRSRSSWSSTRSSKSSDYGDFDLKGRKLFIGNISEKTTEADLEEAFGEFGEIEKCYIPSDWQRKYKKNFAFLIFEERKAARRAVRLRNGVEFQGKVISVTFAKARKGGQMG